jgi:hypothetical protein
MVTSSSYGEDTFISADSCEVGSPMINWSSTRLLIMPFRKRHPPSSPASSSPPINFGVMQIVLGILLYLFQSMLQAIAQFSPFCLLCHPCLCGGQIQCDYTPLDLHESMSCSLAFYGGHPVEILIAICAHKGIYLLRYLLRLAAIWEDVNTQHFCFRQNLTFAQS